MQPLMPEYDDLTSTPEQQEEFEKIALENMKSLFPDTGIEPRTIDGRIVWVKKAAE